jgi:acyl-CoA thioester hydrolase
MSEQQPGLGRWPISCEMPVQWGDMDALGHVNHTRYIRWMETARMVYFNRCGLSEKYKNEGVGPILARIEVDYRLPVQFPDTVTIHTTVTRMGKSSFDMDYRIESAAQNGAIVATGCAFCVTYSYRENRVVPMDTCLGQGFLDLEKTGGGERYST